MSERLCSQCGTAALTDTQSFCEACGTQLPEADGSSSYQPLLGSDPTSVAEYQLLGRLGSGGFGVVYAATDSHGQQVALKVLRAELSDDQRFRRRLAREAQALRRVSGDRTVKIIDVVTEGDQAYLVMELLAGETLDDRVENRGPLQAALLWFAAQGLIEALRDIHSAGIIHRDLKPSNVMYGPDGIKVLDFGISIVAEETSLTQTGGFMGTAAWISPEQVMGHDVTEATDVFNFGLVMAFAATGNHPFGEGRSDALMYRITSEEPDLTGVPSPVKEALERCLHRHPENRPSIAALGEFFNSDGATGLGTGASDTIIVSPDALDAAVGGGGKSGSGTRAVQSPFEPTLTTPPKSKTKMGLVAAAAIAIAAVAGFLIFGNTDTEMVSAPPPTSPSDGGAADDPPGTTISDSGGPTSAPPPVTVPETTTTTIVTTTTTTTTQPAPITTTTTTPAPVTTTTTVRLAPPKLRPATTIAPTTTVAAVATAPRSLAVNQTSDYSPNVRLQWSPPASTGCSSSNSCRTYRIEESDDYYNWNYVGETTSTSKPIYDSVSDWPWGTRKYFRVALLNQQGSPGRWAISWHTPSTFPGPPGWVEACRMGTSNQIRITWGVPISNGGSSITGYQLTWGYGSSEGLITVPSSPQPITMSGSGWVYVRTENGGYRSGSESVYVSTYSSTTPACAGTATTTTTSTTTTSTTTTSTTTTSTTTTSTTTTTPVSPPYVTNSYREYVNDKWYLKIEFSEALTYGCSSPPCNSDYVATSPNATSNTVGPRGTGSGSYHMSTSWSYQGAYPDPSQTYYWIFPENSSLRDSDGNPLVATITFLPVPPPTTTTSTTTTTTTTTTTPPTTTTTPPTTTTTTTPPTTTVPATALPTEVQDFKIDRGDDGYGTSWIGIGYPRVALDWDAPVTSGCGASSSCLSYRVYQSDDYGVTWPSYYSTEETHRTLDFQTGFAWGGAQKRFRVTAINDFGEGPPSGQHYATTPAGPDSPYVPPD